MTDLFTPGSIISEIYRSPLFFTTHQPKKKFIMGKSSKSAAAAPAVAAKANADAKAVSKSKKEGKKVASAPVEAAPVKVCLNTFAHDISSGPDIHRPCRSMLMIRRRNLKSPRRSPPPSHPPARSLLMRRKRTALMTLPTRRRLSLLLPLLYVVPM